MMKTCHGTDDCGFANPADGRGRGSAPHRRFSLSSQLGLTSCLLLAAWAAPGSARAELRLPRIFGDQMVLQRDRSIPVWGWATPGQRISVRLLDATETTAADGEGHWQLRLPPQAAGGPHILTVTAHATEGQPEATQQQQQFSEVLIGDVWVCSGQSNMEWPLSASEGSEEEIPRATHPKLRLIKVPHIIAEAPRDDVEAQWVPCTPDTAADFSAVAYYFGTFLQSQLDVPLGLIGTHWGGTRAEAWTPREAMEGQEIYQEILDRTPEFQPNNPAQASVLYNGMLAPLIPYGIRGAIWYQGESNAGRAEQYASLFPAMIRAWRQQWRQGDFPFLYVQLAPFRYGDADPRNCAELWEAQLHTLHLPQTGMAVINDIGDVKDIHPRNKHDVGRRLALWALHLSHGPRSGVVSGPLFDHIQIHGPELHVYFRHTGNGLTTRDGQPPSHFTLAGSDQRFFPAEARMDGDHVIVTCPDVPQPVAVRFAWQDDATPNLMNLEGLPASAFRSDTFPMATAGKR